MIGAQIAGDLSNHAKKLGITDQVIMEVIEVLLIIFFIAS
jgi:hypothetical protein